MSPTPDPIGDVIYNAQNATGPDFVFSVGNSMVNNETPMTLSPVFVWSMLILILIIIIGHWKMYTKAGRPGWAVLIPFYNIYVLLKIVGRPGWWLILFLVPIVNIVISLIVSIDLARSFKRSEAFGVILLWLFGGIGQLILGFGKSTYADPAITTKSNTTTSA